MGKIKVPPIIDLRQAKPQIQLTRGAKTISDSLPKKID